MAHSQLPIAIPGVSKPSKLVQLFDGGTTRDLSFARFPVFGLCPENASCSRRVSTHQAVSAINFIS